MINETQTRNVRAHVTWSQHGAHRYAWSLIMIVRAIYNKRVYVWSMPMPWRLLLLLTMMECITFSSSLIYNAHKPVSWARRAETCANISIFFLFRRKIAATHQTAPFQTPKIGHTTQLCNVLAIDLSYSPKFGCVQHAQIICTQCDTCA